MTSADMHQSQLVFPAIDLGQVVRRPRRLRQRRAPRGDILSQGVLPFPSGTRTCKSIEEELTVLLRQKVSVVVTDNTRTMVSWRFRRGIELRIHHMFLGAEDAVIEALGRCIQKGDATGSQRINEFIRLNQHRIRPSQREPNLEPKGRVHDLDQIVRNVWEQFFSGELDVSVTWGGKRHARKRRRSIRLGVYVPSQKLIRIHPALDQPFVPAFVVEWVVYHELLHHVLGIPVVRGRRECHSKEFRRREALYPDHQRAKRWEDKHLAKLLRF